MILLSALRQGLFACFHITELSGSEYIYINLAECGHGRAMHTTCVRSFLKVRISCELFIMNVASATHVYVYLIDGIIIAFGIVWCYLCMYIWY